MTILKKFKTPNARLFYIKAKQSDFDFHRMDRLLREALSHAPRLAAAHKYIDLYFNFKNEDIKFGREVIGYNSLAREDESIYGYELLEMGQGNEVDLEVTSIFNFEDIKIFFKKHFSEELDRNSHYRLRFQWNEEAKRLLSYSVMAQILR
jgi:hypothetical protein